MTTRTRLLALVALASLALTACTRGSFPELWRKTEFDKRFVLEFCHLFEELLADDFKERPHYYLGCLAKYGAIPNPTGTFGSELLGTKPEPSSAAAANEAWQAGEMLMAMYVAAGKVSAGKFPAIVLAVPEGPPMLDVSVRAAIFDPEKGEPKTVFKALDVTLRTVDQGSGSTNIGEGSAKFTRKDPFAGVLFEDVVADQELEVVADFAGGSIKDCIVLLTVGARNSGEAVAAVSRQARTGRASVAPGAHMASADSNVGKLLEMGMVFVKAAGKVKSSRVPEMILDFAVNGTGPVNVSASIGVVADEDLETPKRKYLPKSATAELYAVDRSGETDRLAKATQKVDKTGNAEIVFDDVTVPESANLRVVLEVNGKRVRDAVIVGTASVQ